MAHLVIDVKNHELVVHVGLRYSSPPRLESLHIGDDIAVESPVVMGLNHGVGAFAGDVVDRLDFET